MNENSIQADEQPLQENQNISDPGVVSLNEVPRFKYVVLWGGMILFATLFVVSVVGNGYILFVSDINFQSPACGGDLQSHGKNLLWIQFIAGLCLPLLPKFISWLRNLDESCVIRCVRELFEFVSSALFMSTVCGYFLGSLIRQSSQCLSTLSVILLLVQSGQFSYFVAFFVLYDITRNGILRLNIWVIFSVPCSVFASVITSCLIVSLHGVGWWALMVFEAVLFMTPILDLKDKISPFKHTSMNFSFLPLAIKLGVLFSDLPTLSTDDTIGLHTLLVGFRAYPIFVYALFRMGSSENSLLPLQYGISKEAAGSIFDLLDIFDMFEMGAILPEGSIRTCVLTFLILGVAVLQYDVMVCFNSDDPNLRDCFPALMPFGQLIFCLFRLENEVDHNNKLSELYQKNDELIAKPEIFVIEDDAVSENTFVLSRMWIGWRRLFSPAKSVAAPILRILLYEIPALVIRIYVFFAFSISTAGFAAKNFIYIARSISLVADYFQLIRKTRSLDGKTVDEVERKNTDLQRVPLVDSEASLVDLENQYQNPRNSDEFESVNS